MDGWTGNMLRSQSQKRLRPRRPIQEPERGAAYGGRISLAGLLPVSPDGLVGG
ncbi:MAG: hypothetical protein JWL93_1289, partial [Hyphomicrobiales bacterium]|nr:hypothetical protein [Hyphomicrobiales bacterium]